MNRVKVLLVTGLIISGLVSAQTQTPPSNIRLRGTITGWSNQELRVKTREGNDVVVNLTASTRLSELYARKLRDIKQGDFVGVTAVPGGADSPLLAREVHIFAKAQRGTGEGHYEWDLEPGASMTNANVDAIVNSRHGKELTLGYKGGSQKIVIPPDTPIISFKTADRSVLKSGIPVFCIVQRSANGSLTALHVSVGENGMKPPM